MYHLIDLSNRTKKSFESKIELLAYWRFQNLRCSVPGPLNFRDLNVTGKDTYNPLFGDPWIRRFQVLDDDGRSQDIRTWVKEIEIVNAMRHFPHRRPAPSQARFRVDPAAAGSKMPIRKGHSGAFAMQRVRDRKGNLGFDYEDDLLGFIPVKDDSAPRIRNRSGRSERREFHSWKSQTKNTSQWGRHTERAAETPIRKRVFEELDVAKLELELVRVKG